MKKIITIWDKVSTILTMLPAPDLSLFARLYVASVFYKSGRTKVDSVETDGLWDALIAYFTPSENALMLFEHEYAVPVISHEIAAQLAVLGETILPLFLIVGMFTRLSAIGLMGMTLVIQIFVYPGMWYDHMLWIAPLLLLIARGSSVLSVDTFLCRKFSVR